MKHACLLAALHAFKAVCQCQQSHAAQSKQVLDMQIHMRAGDGVLGSVLDPRRGTMYFDGGALGITDVKIANGTFYAWYMGLQDAALVNATAATIIRGGVAVSQDGIHWSRCNGPNSSYGALLDITPGAEKFIFGPHIYDFSQASSIDKTPHSSPSASLPAPICSELPAVVGNFTMLYHSQLPHAQQLTAHSVDLLHFNKSGSLHGVSPSPSNSSFDHFAASDGRIVQTPDGYILMYEACDAHFSFSLGLARSKDGINFVKDTSCTGTPGGPVFKPSIDPNAFDGGDVGTPFPLLQPDGELWVYYVGFGRKPALGNASTIASNGSPASQIGLAISQPNALGKQDYCSFKRVSAN